MNEIILNAHIHTRYSDGMKTHREIADIAATHDLDAILITDHNVFPTGVGGYYKFGNKQILVVIGEEIHDTNRQPQKNHLLAFGIDKSYTKYAADPQSLINKITEDGGLTFLAHAYDPALPAFGDGNLSWVDWSVTGFSGIELWNNLSEIKVRNPNKLQAYFFAIFPSFISLEPPIQIREKWDQLLMYGAPLSAIGGSDAHTLPFKIGPFRIKVFPYDYHFRSINNHLLLEYALVGDAKKDQLSILNSLKAGRLFIANDQVFASRGFRCWIDKNNSNFQMGDKVPYQPDLVLKAILPAKADCYLLKNGKRIQAFRNSNKVIIPITSEGIYRLECYRRYRFRKRGWIFTNPFYLS